MGWHHLLQVVFQESGEFLGYFPIWRSADQKPFSRDDIEFLRNAAPHIAHGLRAGTLLERRDRPLEQPDEFQSLFPWRTGVILLDCDGKLLAVDPDARGIFQQLGILDGVSVDRFAPAPRTLAAIFPGREPNSERVAAPGIVLKLRGVRMTAADGREYTTVLLERGETAGARRARMSARWGLSQREAEILSFIGDGKTGPEIALLLAISHDTIRKHTSKILDKLGVETRTAAAMLTRNSYDN
jgi:DNA-binding CsgD family transcriptional regulator